LALEALDHARISCTPSTLVGDVSGVFSCSSAEADKEEQMGKDRILEAAQKVNAILDEAHGIRLEDDFQEEDGTAVSVYSASDCWFDVQVDDGVAKLIVSRECAGTGSVQSHLLKATFEVESEAFERDLVDTLDRYRRVLNLLEDPTN
jgi:hypothetical protein